MNDFATASAEKSAYSEHWAQNAASFASQGCYEWMSEQLDRLQPKRVFDIGCGTGEGVSALHQRFGCEILAIDENAQCLRRTHRHFRNQGIASDLRLRFKYRQYNNGMHSTQIDPSPITVSERLSFVQADLLLPDPAFESFLRSKTPFDAVTIWLIGTFKCRSTCADLLPLQITLPEDYRLHIQNRIYNLASEFLRPGGVLQVVDRGEAPESKELHDDILQGHRDQAALGSLQVQEMSYRPYLEHATAKGVEMVLSQDLPNAPPSEMKTAMISVLSVKA